MARGSSTRGRKGPRPRYRWYDRINADTTVLAFGTEALINLFENHVAADLVGLTAKRLLMRMSLRPVVEGENCEWAAGMTQVSGDAFTAGAVPDPSLDNHDWWWYDADGWRSEQALGPITKGYEYDIKMNRRLRSEDMRVVHVIRNTHTSHSLEYMVTTRRVT